MVRYVVSNTLTFVVVQRCHGQRRFRMTHRVIKCLHRHFLSLSRYPVPILGLRIVPEICWEVVIEELVRKRSILRSVVGCCLGNV
jgi:hypothetical protein